MTSYVERVDAFGASHHWRLNEASGASFAERIGGRLSAAGAGSLEYLADTIAQDDGDGRCLGLGGGANDSILSIPSNAAWGDGAGLFACLVQPGSASKKQQLLIRRGPDGPAAGTWGLEITADGALYGWRRDGDGVLREVTTAAGIVIAGTSQHVGLDWGPAGLRVWRNGAVVASEATPTANWATTTASDVFVGRYFEGSDGLDGLIGHVVFKNAQPTEAEIGGLVLPRTAVTAAAVAPAGAAVVITTSPAKKRWSTADVAIPARSTSDKRLLAVAVLLSQSDPAWPIVRFGPAGSRIAGMRVNETIASSAKERAAIYVWFDDDLPAAGGAHPLQVWNFPGCSASGWAIAQAFTGAAQFPYRGDGHAGEGLTNSSASFKPPHDGSYLFDAILVSNTGAAAAGDGQAAVLNATVGSIRGAASTKRVPTGGSSQSMEWRFSSGRAAHAMLVVEPAAKEATYTVLAADSQGAVGDGRANDQPALQALLSGGRKRIIRLTGGKTYKLQPARFGTPSSGCFPQLEFTQPDVVLECIDAGAPAVLKLGSPPAPTTDNAFVPVVQINAARSLLRGNIKIDGSRTAYYDQMWEKTENGGNHAIRVMGGAKNCVIRGWQTVNAHCDGLDYRDKCQDIYVRGVVCDFSRRNGASWIECDHVTMDGCEIRNSGRNIGSNLAQNPKEAADAEPNSGGTVQYIFFNRINAHDNGGRAYVANYFAGRHVDMAAILDGNFNANNRSNVGANDIRLSLRDGTGLSKLVVDGNSMTLPFDAGPGNKPERRPVVHDVDITNNRMPKGATRHIGGRNWTITGNSNDVTPGDNVDIETSTDH